MVNPLQGISSMATRAVLSELVAAYEARSDTKVQIESVGGVDAARRVQAGEQFDVVFLASDAIDKLIASGHIEAASKVDLMRSATALAVRQGAPVPDVGDEAALRNTVRNAGSICYSTGPSGVALTRLFAQWGIADEVRARTVQAPPGVPVGRLIAEGKAELGFQQVSELIHVPGIHIVGPLPPDVAIVTTFSAGVCSASTRSSEAHALLRFLASEEASPAKQRQGMEPV